MPYNIDLEQRLDRLLPRLGKAIKKKMFGGIGYLMNGNMAFGIHKDALVLRVTPAQADLLLKQDSVRVFDITGRPMAGWLLVSPDGVKTDDSLMGLLQLAFDYVKTLPPK
jgi:TfoX N-terminal domain